MREIPSYAHLVYKQNIVVMMNHTVARDSTVSAFHLLSNKQLCASSCALHLPFDFT